MIKKVIKEQGFRSFHGKIHIKAWQKNPDGTESLIKDDTFPNLIVTAGKKSILKTLGGLTIACCSDSGAADDIGTGDSAAAAAACQTDLQGACKVWLQICTSDKVYACCTLFLSKDFGYCCNNWTWNELGLRDTNNNMWARQVDACPLLKNNTKRAIVEWQLSM